MTVIRLEKVSRQFDTSIALNQIDLTVSDGEFLLIVGPSGSGKTTLLRLIAGLEQPTCGQIYFDDTMINSVPAFQRNVAMIFGQPILYPHLTVYDNIAFGLKRHLIPIEDIKNTVLDISERLGIISLLNRKPQTLSAGQKQRVALAGALIRKPKAFLLDEPLNHLDSHLQKIILDILAVIQRDTNIPIICVTHHFGRIIEIANRICIIEEGIIKKMVLKKDFPIIPESLELF
ncbi:MAG: ABC transporter ATP-binding protein [Anaerohalosphaeraceae bacterium]